MYTNVKRFVTVVTVALAGTLVLKSYIAAVALKLYILLCRVVLSLLTVNDRVQSSMIVLMRYSRVIEHQVVYPFCI